MKQVTLKLTPDQLRLLATLASDQIFRKEFIDSRMPGNTTNYDEISQGKALVGRIRLMLDPSFAKRTHL